MKNYNTYTHIQFYAFVITAWAGILPVMLTIIKLFTQNSYHDKVAIDLFISGIFIIVFGIVLLSIGQLLFTLSRVLEQSDKQHHIIGARQPFSMRRFFSTYITNTFSILRVSNFITLMLCAILFFRFVDFYIDYPYSCGSDCYRHSEYNGAGTWLILITSVIIGVCFEHILRISYFLFSNSQKNYILIATKYPHLTVAPQLSITNTIFNIVLFLCSMPFAFLWILVLIEIQDMWEVGIIMAITIGWLSVLVIGQALYLNHSSLRTTKAIQQQLTSIAKKTVSTEKPPLRQIQLLSLLLIVSISIILIGCNLSFIMSQIIFAMEWDYGNYISYETIYNTSIFSTVIIGFIIGIVFLAFGELLLIVRHLARETHLNHQLLSHIQSKKTTPS